MESFTERLTTIEKRMSQIVDECHREAHDTASIVNDRIFKSQLAQCAKHATQNADKTVQSSWQTIESKFVADTQSLHTDLKTQVAALVTELMADFNAKLDALNGDMHALVDRLNTIHVGKPHTELLGSEMTVDTMQIVREMPVTPEVSINTPPKSPRQAATTHTVCEEDIPPLVTPPQSPRTAVRAKSYEDLLEMCVNTAGHNDTNNKLADLARVVDEQTAWGDIAVAVNQCVDSTDVATIFEPDMRLHQVIACLVANINVDASDIKAIFNYLRGRSFKSILDVYWASYFLAHVALRFMTRITKTDVADKVSHFEQLASHKDVPLSPRAPLTPRSP